mmetsp:Transcript_8058/g.19094  ORF Transcript_8058/g.19094 Transcript_8058/m.19094 type:complete len:211 (+) Transcript_8058:1029-1661(+)
MVPQRCPRFQRHTHGVFEFEHCLGPPAEVSPEEPKLLVPAELEATAVDAALQPNTIHGHPLGSGLVAADTHLLSSTGYLGQQIFIVTFPAIPLHLGDLSLHLVALVLHSLGHLCLIKLAFLSRVLVIRIVPFKNVKTLLEQAQNPIAHVVHELPVMGHDDQSHILHGLQVPLQPQDRVPIQVIRGLVKHNYLTLYGQSLRQCHPHPPPTA